MIQYVCDVCRRPFEAHGGYKFDCEKTDQFGEQRSSYKNLCIDVCCLACLISVAESLVDAEALERSKEVT